MSDTQTWASDLRVVMLTHKLDESDWLIGFTVAWIKTLAARVQRVDVVTLEQRSATLPTNVHVYSLGKERGSSRVKEFMAFQRIMADRTRQADVIFGHLTPRYTWLAAPWAALHRVPQCLWYTHRQIDPELRLALRCVRWIATAAPGSFPIPSEKVHVMGHGIDSERYSPGHTIPNSDPPLILAVGRIAPIKRHNVLIDAAAIMKARSIPVRVAIAGAPATAEGIAYQDKLQAQIAALGLSDSVKLLGPQHTDDLIGWYRRASIVTNLSPIGLFDKAALEAAMTARPIIVTNPDFDDLLGDQATILRLPDPPDATVLADRLAAVLAKPAAERQLLGQHLRERAIQQHSLERLIDRLIALWQS